MELTTKTPKTPKKIPKGKWVRYKYPSRPEVFDAFAKWMAYPKAYKELKTQQDFAKLHDVSPDTLSDYKKKAEFWKKVEENKNDIQSDIEDKRLLDRIYKDMHPEG